MRARAHALAPENLTVEKVAQLMDADPTRVHKCVPIAREVRTSIQPPLEYRKALRNCRSMGFDSCPELEDLGGRDFFAPLQVGFDKLGEACVRHCPLSIVHPHLDIRAAGSFRVEM